MVDRGDGVRLAAELSPGDGPVTVFLPGFGSDMTGGKVTSLAASLHARGRPTLRLDYSGHGASEGSFADGTIGRWRDDASAVIERLAPGPLVLWGSSMGGWIALLLARAWPGARVRGVVGVATAPDFTERRIWASLDTAARARLEADGVIHVDTGWASRVPITRALIEDGRRHALLASGAPIDIEAPVRLFQGQRDDSVDWRTALELAGRIGCPDTRVTLIKDGDHRLSRPSDIGPVLDALLELTGARL